VLISVCHDVLVKEEPTKVGVPSHRAPRVMYVWYSPTDVAPTCPQMRVGGRAAAAGSGQPLCTVSPDVSQRKDEEKLLAWEPWKLLWLATSASAAHVQLVY
jgi:hypothetical protein